MCYRGGRRRLKSAFSFMETNTNFPFRKQHLDTNVHTERIERMGMWGLRIQLPHLDW